MKPILNGQFELPTDGWCHAMAIGEFPNSVVEPDPAQPGGMRLRRVMQICDRDSAVAMVAAFNRAAAAPEFCGLLVDRDHESDDPSKTTDAWGWVMGLENRDDGLYANIRWTDLGEPAVRGGRFRFLSPVFAEDRCEDLGNGRLRPLVLDKLGLTNDPNIRPLRPLSNRAALENEQITSTAGEPGRKESSMDYKKELLALLGLDVAATDEDISAAITGKQESSGEMENMRKDCADLTNRCAKAESELAVVKRAELERNVEADLEEHKDVIANRDEVKAALMTNRSEALKLLKALNKPTTRLHNRASAVTPSIAADVPRQQQEFVESLVRENKAASYAKAWAIAPSLKPELFPGA